MKSYRWCPVFLQNWGLTGYNAILHRERYGGKYFEYCQLMQEGQWWNKSELRAYQDRRLKKLIEHAYETVPYYRRIFEDGRLKPSDITSQEDLAKIPLLTREEIKRNFNDLLSKNIKDKQLKRGHTSGTTGSPLEICYDQATINITYAALDRHYRWAGCQLARRGDRMAVVRGNVIVPLNQKNPPFWRYNHFHNQLLLSSFHLSRNNLGLYFEEMQKFQPDIIDGYPSTLYVLAKYLKNHGERFSVKAVISSSETLYDFQREMIEKNFQCKIFDYYALAERVVFATECEAHEGHHLNMEYGISEIVDENGFPVSDGTPGKLVGTSIHNFGMPLIRYLTGDRTTIRPKSCSCGRGLVLMDDVTTKAEDTLTLKDGRLISPSVLTHPFKPLNSIEESQIIQKDFDWIVVRIVRRRDYSDSDTRHLIREFKARIGEDTKIDVDFVDELPRSNNGKFRWVISEVPLGI